MKLRYARPEHTGSKVIVGALTLTIPPDGIIEVSDEDAKAILAKSKSFAVVNDNPPTAPRPEPKAEPVREDLGPLVRVQVVPAHRSPAGFLIEGKTYKHDAQGFVEIPQKIAARWISQKRAKPAPVTENAEPSAEPVKADTPAPKAEDKPRARRGQRAEEPAPTAPNTENAEPSAEPQA